MTAYDWLLLLVVGSLCAAYAAAGYFFGYLQRNESNVALLRRLASTSRQAALKGGRLPDMQLTMDAEEAEAWADKVGNKCFT